MDFKTAIDKMNNGFFLMDRKNQYSIAYFDNFQDFKENISSYLNSWNFYGMEYPNEGYYQTVQPIKYEKIDDVPDDAKFVIRLIKEEKIEGWQIYDHIVYGIDTDHNLNEIDTLANESFFELLLEVKSIANQLPSLKLKSKDVIYLNVKELWAQ